MSSTHGIHHAEIWRENYQGFRHFNPRKFAEITCIEAQLLTRDAFGFRKLAWQELRKYRKTHLARLASYLLQRYDPSMLTTWTRPGIRAQLLDTRSHQLVQDLFL